MSASPLSSIAGDPKRTIPIGFQLFTVRGEFEADVPATLKALRQLGYQGVEFWGYAGTPNVYQRYSAPDLRTMLDDLGLKCCGMHLDLKALSPESFPRTVANNQILGSQYLNLAAAQQKMESEAGIAELAALLNRCAAQCPPDMRMGYHAHGFDFVRIKDAWAWQLLFRQADPKVNMQMDVGNCLGGKGDPIALLKEFPARTWTIHIKEFEDKTFDSPYYQEVFRLCETTCNTQWYIVEMGGPEGKGFDIPREALQKLRRLGK